jgi:hypothetical protein
LVTGSTYYFKVAAINGTGIGAYSSARSIATGNPAAKLAITQQSVGTQAGKMFSTQPLITVQDSDGLKVSSSVVVVTASVSSGGSLVGTLARSAVAGVATYSGLGIAGVSGATYTITYSSPGLTSITADITVTPGDPSRLEFVTLPVGNVSGSRLLTQPTVKMTDSSGNTVLGNNSFMDVTVNGGTLSGNRGPRLNSSTGTVAYGDLVHTTAGNWILTVTSRSGGQSVSANFTTSP